MAVPVVADADTLFGGTTRGLLIHLDYQGLIRLHWSPLILDEMSRALVETGRKADRAAATRHEALMRAALPQAEVPTADVQSQFEAVAWAMRSAKDTHVAACAHVLHAQHYYRDTPVVSLVTKNIRDFGVRKLATLGIEVQRPDAFLLDLFGLDESRFAAAFAALRGTLRSNPTPEQFLERLAADGQAETAAAMLASWQAGTAAL
ncbi:MAG: PIN domain-containing protein [Rubrivivax sp.]|nr:PIN domain-containing protein [Rubrivivax sp.]